jgi:membrane-bound ClpP family serine protease
MELFGYSLQAIYLFCLITGGILTLLYILFGDILEGIFEILPDGFLNPTLILSFITFLSSSGYLFEKLSNLNSFIILLISIVIALILVIFLNVFVLIPLSSAEESLAFKEEDLKGRVGKVIISIPKNGYGEVIIEGNGGTIAMSATGFENESIPYESKVLVIEVKESVLYVSPYDQLD